MALQENSVRVALVGNLNNNFSALMKWLRLHGFDAELYYRSEPHFFHAKADTFDISFLRYCHEIDWLDRGFRPADLEITLIRKLLLGYEKIIAQGDEAAVLNYCGIPIDIYFPYGTDVSKYAQLPHHFTGWEMLRLLMRRNGGYSFFDVQRGTFSKYLHEAIRTAKYVFMGDTNPDYQLMLSKISISGEFRNVNMPFLYFPEVEQYVSKAKEPAVHWRDVIDDLRDRHEFLILYHGRQLWKTKLNEFSGKSNDQLIRGFALFVKDHPSNVHLIMIEFGPDVESSKQLIRELQIEDKVTWLPQMYRKDLMYLISQVDLGAGEFGRSYLTFGTIIECMVMGKPVIHYREDRLYEGNHSWLYPLVNARSATEIADKLNYYAARREQLCEMGKLAQKWTKEVFFEKSIEEIVTVLNA